MADRQLSRRQVLGAVGTGLVGGLAGCSFGAPETGAPGGSAPDGAGGEEALGNDGLQQVDDEAGGGDSGKAAVYRELIGSVAGVRVETPSGVARGTSWVYDGNYLVTNEHVVAGADGVSAWFEASGWQPGSVVATDVYSDLAVVEVEDRPDDSNRIPLVDEEPPVGTEVMVIGNPFGLSGSLSSGIISGHDRTLPAANGFSIPDAVQTDAAVNSGNSGGPLVTLDGNVVAVINSKRGDNLGFGISAALTRRVVPALIQDGSYDHPYMGVRLTEVTPAYIEANDFDVTRGVYIDEAIPNGPADGVLQGSTGETTVNGRAVPTGGDVVYRMEDTEIPTQQDLSTFLALETSPGETIDVGIVRDGSRQTVELPIGTRPEP